MGVGRGEVGVTGAQQDCKGGGKGRGMKTTTSLIIIAEDKQRLEGPCMAGFTKRTDPRKRLGKEETWGGRGKDAKMNWEKGTRELGSGEIKEKGKNGRISRI